MPVSLVDLLSLLTVLALLGVIAFSYRDVFQGINKLAKSLVWTEVKELYQEVIQPYQLWLNLTLISILVDLTLLASPPSLGRQWLEFPLGLLLALNTTFLGFKLFTKFFNSYLLNVAFKEERKLNSELLALAKFLAKAVIILIIIFIFAQTHQINLVGLVASLGVGGVTIAFASQKIIEQILWSIVLFIDQPFTVDDYIHLPDKTLGKVESVGWRSTQIRLSGKNTLMIVPNSNLAQMSIQNLTRAKRVLSIVSLNFLRVMSDEEKALIEQLILSSTSDILGIDHQLTQVTFENRIDEADRNYVQAQIIFFILGARERSMELRKGLLEIARENIVKRLQEFGVAVDFDESIVDITQPMNL